MCEEREKVHIFDPSTSDELLAVRLSTRSAHKYDERFVICAKLLRINVDSTR